MKDSTGKPGVGEPLEDGATVVDEVEEPVGGSVSVTESDGDGLALADADGECDNDTDVDEESVEEAVADTVTDVDDVSVMDTIDAGEDDCET